MENANNMPKQCKKLTRSQKAFHGVIQRKGRIKFSVMHPDLEALLKHKMVHIIKVDGIEYIESLVKENESADVINS